MPRLFTGIQIPSHITQSLQIMQGGIAGARWVGVEDFHITLRFIGDIETEVANELAQRLDDVVIAPFDIALSGVSWFGGQKPKSLHALVAPSPDLDMLQMQHERICRAVGLRAEGRKFIPHVTIARLRGVEVSTIEEFVGEHALLHSKPFNIGEFALFSARPSRGGGPYAVVERYLLPRLAG